MAFTPSPLCFGGYDKLQDNLVKLKSPKILYKFRRLEIKQILKKSEILENAMAEFCSDDFAV